MAYRKNLALKKAVVELLPAVEKPCDLRVDAENEARSVEMELPLVRNQENIFDEAMTAVSKELSAARVKSAELRWNRDEVL